MAPFNFNWYGYRFQKGLTDIRRAYDATIAALEKQHENAQSEMLKLQRAVAAGELDPTEYDGDGEPLYAKEQYQEIVIEDAAATIPIARRSYVVVIHHYWERNCDQWMQRKKAYSPEAAYTWLEERGISVDRDNLEFLRLASNTIKHNSPKLAEKNPALFQISNSVIEKPHYHDALRLQEIHIDRMFDAVGQSGLQVDTPGIF